MRRDRITLPLIASIVICLVSPFKSISKLLGLEGTDAVPEVFYVIVIITPIPPNKELTNNRKQRLFNYNFDILCQLSWL